MRRVYNGSGGVAITFHASAEPLRTNVQDDLIVTMSQLFPFPDLTH